MSDTPSGDGSNGRAISPLFKGVLALTVYLFLALMVGLAGLVFVSGYTKEPRAPSLPGLPPHASAPCEAAASDGPAPGCAKSPP